jgi:uncharacterized protein YjbI with pentapeptide repeats
MNLRLIILGILVLIAILNGSSFCQEGWVGFYSNGDSLSRNKLDTIILNHKNWLHDSTTGAKINLEGAILDGANFKNVDLRNANLGLASIKNAALMFADLRGANLIGADLSEANLTEAYLGSTNLSGAELTQANLADAFLGEANLSGAFFKGVNLSGAYLIHANLSGATLWSVDFSRANLNRANLSGADLWWANLSGANFEPDSLPYALEIAYAYNLDEMKWRLSPAKLVELRNRFVESGFDQQARQITCALKRHGQSIISWIFFDLTIEYGINLWRPWLIIIGFWFGTSIFYYLHFIGNPRRKAFLLIKEPIVTIENAMTERRNDDLEKRLERLHAENHYLKDERDTIFGRLPVRIRLIGWAMFFSAISALNVGFRKFSTGRGLLGLTRKEIELEAHGWVRVVSGLQSLVSAYLILLWAANLFATPFK